MILLLRILFTIPINSIVPARDTVKAQATRKEDGASGNRSIAAITPSLHHSMVPAVVGDTNLFLVILCMIRPDTAKLLPAASMAKSLGILLESNICICPFSRLKSSEIDISATPTNIEIAEIKTRKTHWNILNAILFAAVFFVYESVELHFKEQVVPADVGLHDYARNIF